MDLLCITDASKQFGISSKTLRYYENVGILKPIRMKNNKYRYYDDEAVERIKQILILRKMQITIKDIIRIYENENMSTVVEVFVDRINAIDEQVGALSELKHIIHEFLQTMLKNGITKISALPLLYDEMDKQLTVLEERKPVTYEELSTVSEKLRKEIDLSIVDLPSMRMLSSIRKDNGQSDIEGFMDWLVLNNIPRSLPGSHESFEYQEAGTDTVIICKIKDDFKNHSPFIASVFCGGLFVAANVYLDEDLGERFRTLIKAFDSNKYYQIDYQSDGSLRHEAMLENLISPDNQRELVALLVPVKERMADPALFDRPEEISSVSIREIEAANPVLWEVEVPLDKMTQTHINNSYYRINEDGEAEYIAWIIRAVLNTNVSVKLPFRIDMEFRQSGKGRTGVVFYHGEDTGYSTGHIGSRGFGVNMSNDNEQMIQAIRFAQPIFWDDFHFPGRGSIKTNELNRLSWIVGEKHLAVIINGEVRYCGVNFPYMTLDLSRKEVCPIVIGTHGNDKIYFRSIHVSQLAETSKNKIKQGELAMITKQSNNIIPIIHQLVTDEYGENYWFNGCAKYVMECLGEPDFDYWFFAGLTGDVFTQHYTYTKYAGDALTSYMTDENPKEFVKDTFAKCGYAATFVSKKELKENSEMYLNTLTSYIDKGIPVITWGYPVGVLVGYEEYGKILLYITGNNNQPERMALDKALSRHDIWDAGGKGGWIFVGQKKESIPLAKIYRDAIAAIPKHMSVKTDTYCFGAEAFRAWARDVESGKFDGMTVEEFDAWSYYTNYVCVLATNSGCGRGFLDKAQELNHDFTFLEEVRNQFRITGLLWNGQYSGDDVFAAEYAKAHKSEVANNLEAIGGGFNITLETLQDKTRREKIAAVICKCADCMDEIMRIINENL